MKFQLPPAGTILYKYYPPETMGRVLSNGKTRFSPLIEFNDPFELNTHEVDAFSEFEFGHALANEIYEVLLSGEEISGSGPIVELVRAYARGEIKDISQYDFAMNLGVAMARKKIIRVPSPLTQKVQLRLAKIMGAFCLSETFDNLLMWSHYAKNHEGFVLGIDPWQVGDAFRAMAPVSYQETYPTSKDARSAASTYLGREKGRQESGMKTAYRWFFTKSKEWAYEREWRAIRDSGCDPVADHKSYDINSQLVDIPPAAMYSLHVGCRSSHEVAAEYVARAREIHPNIKVFKCRPSFSAFSLDCQSYDDPWVNHYPAEDQVL
jgi:hypothetical protein